MYSFLTSESDVLHSAVNRFGLDAQLAQLQEECGELIVAINHLRRGRDYGRDNVVEEMTDVLIMIEQITIGLDCSEEIDNMMFRKISKLIGKLQ